MPPTGHINYELSASAEPITKAKLFHHVWIHDVGISDMDLILDLLNSKVPTNLFSLHLSAIDYDALKLFILSKFKVIKAGGGLVKKKGQTPDDLQDEKMGFTKRKEGVG
jgi:hypothetical protein